MAKNKNKNKNKNENRKNLRSSTEPDNNNLKKQRTESILNRGSRIFHPFRAVGIVSNHVPFCFYSRGSENYVTTSTGNSFQIFDCDKLSLKFVGPHLNSTINAIAAADDYTFVSVQSTLCIFKRAKQVGEYTLHNGDIFSITVFGSHILTLGEDNILNIYDYTKGELYSTIEFGKGFNATCVLHPSTYVNKILVGSNQGTLQIWNIKSCKMIHEFQSYNDPITTLCQSPVLDVVAIGFQSGAIVLQNIKFDEKIIKLRQEGRVTSISFRTDEHPIMATANNSGDICLWDLEKRKLFHVMRSAHESLIPSIHFFAKQPVLLTSSLDNSLKQWIFDSADGMGRVLKQRSGHSSPPNFIRYYANGFQIISAGLDRTLRNFSTIKDSQSFELSQGSIVNKAKARNTSLEEMRVPPITSFASSQVKQKQWDNIVTCHSGDKCVQTWNYQNKVIGSHKLVSQDGSVAKSVCISACGNFAIVGYQTGRIDTFNLQSGLHRKKFIGHQKEVTGVGVDNLNRHLVSCSLDGTANIWEFSSTKLIGTLHLGSAITQLEIHHESQLVAFVCDDCTLKIFDLDTQKLVREFSGHTNRITDICFSPDGRWIVSSSSDGTIKVFDLPTAMMVDSFKTHSIPTSITFSPNSDFLATTHVANNAIFLWANKLQFSSVTLKGMSDEETMSVDMPTVSITSLNDNDQDIQDNSDSFFDEYLNKEEQDDGDDNGKEKKEGQKLHIIDQSLISFSGLSKSKWQNLLNIDLVKKRNKPIEPPKAPEKAPFFLPTLPGLQPRFALPEDNKEENSSRILNIKNFEYDSEFVRKLLEAEESKNYEEVIEMALGMSASAIDAEIRSLSLQNNFRQIFAFIHLLEQMISQNKNFEILQVYLNLFLKIHGTVLSENIEFERSLEELIEVEMKTWGIIQNKISQALCLIDFAKSLN